jgi:hypothetical protein
MLQALPHQLHQTINWQNWRKKNWTVPAPLCLHTEGQEMGAIAPVAENALKKSEGRK